MTQPQADEQRLDVVVIDDVVRFAWHAYHLLNGEPGLGIGDLRPTDEQQFWSSEGVPQACEAANRRLAVWWVPLRADWNVRLDKVLDRLKNSRRVYFLIDLFLYSSAGSTQQGSPTRFANEIIRYLVESAPSAPWRVQDSKPRRPSDYLQVVSSYRSGILRVALDRGTPLRLPVRAKSPELFHSIARENGLLARGASSQPAEPSEILHVLVTGAGFEFRREDMPTEVRPFGMPSTVQLLREVKNRLPEEKGVTKEVWERLEVALDNVDLDVPGGLDDAMDSILKEVQEALSKKSQSPKALAYEVELRFREIFRRTLERYDFGTTSQSLNAAYVPWGAWLTTNYTHYSDRAIAMHEDAAKLLKAQQSSDWRIVSTPHEADRCVQEWQHKGPDKVDACASFLFKLHGDISHVHTMAIAGHDKEPYSGLAFTVESIAKMYSAAESFLQLKLGDSGTKRLVWHIVGHGLRDRLLVATIRRVHESASQSRTFTSETFLVANGSKNASQEAADLLRGELSTSARTRFIPVAMDARSYTLRVLERGLPRTRDESSAFVQALGPVRGKRKR